jgi:hypothetical protein
MNVDHGINVDYGINVDHGMNVNHGINVDQQSKLLKKCKYNIQYLHLFTMFDC